MMAPAHMIAGATSWAVYQHYVITSYPVTLTETFGLMAVSAGAALLPDIDHPTSTVGRKIYPISKLISMVFGHRGFTHSLLAFLGMMYLLYHWVPDEESVLLLNAIAVGYLSHLIGDVITPAGLPLLYPIQHRFTTPWTIKAGGLGECIVVVLYGLFALALYTQWHRLLIDQLYEWMH